MQTHKAVWIRKWKEKREREKCFWRKHKSVVYLRQIILPNYNVSIITLITLNTRIKLVFLRHKILKIYIVAILIVKQSEILFPLFFYNEATLLLKQQQKKTREENFLHFKGKRREKNCVYKVLSGMKIVERKKKL